MKVIHNATRPPLTPDDLVNQPTGWFTRFSNWLRNKFANAQPISTLRVKDDKPLPKDEHGNVALYKYIVTIKDRGHRHTLEAMAVDSQTAQNMALIEFTSKLKTNPPKQQQVTKRNDDNKPVEWQWETEIKTKHGVLVWRVKTDTAENAKLKCLQAYLSSLFVAVQPFKPNGY